MAAAITIAGLRKSFGPHLVLDGVDLTVEEGEIFALLGPNGAGKTTTINVLTTLVRPDRGRVLVAGHDVRRSPEAVKARIALTGQSAAVDDSLNARENLVMFGRLSGLRPPVARTRATELLASFGLSEARNRRVSTFSGGMRRRLDLALSFVVQPQILFLDEPTTGLDTRSRRELWGVISSLAEAGTTVFLTTQYLEEADRLADRIAVIDGGRVIALGTAAELKARIGGDTVQLRTADGNLLEEIPTDGTVAGLRQAVEALDTSGLEGTVSLHRPTLDDVFLDLTAGGSTTVAKTSAARRADR